MGAGIVSVQAPGIRERRNPAASIVVAASAFVPMLLVYTIDSPVPIADRLTAATTWALCLLPLWLTLRTPVGRRSPIPFLPVIGLAYGWYFALPITYGAYNQHWRIVVDPSTDYSAPLRLALAGWIMLLIGYRIVGPRWNIAPRKEADPAFHGVQLVPGVAPLLVLVGLPLASLPRVMNVPAVLLSLTQFGNGLLMLGLSLLVVKQVRGQIRTGERLVLWTGAAVHMLLALGTGFIAPVLMFAATIFFSVWIARQSLGVVWTLAMVTVILSAAFLKSVSTDFRKMQRLNPEGTGAVARVGLVGKLIQMRIERDGLVGSLAVGQKATSTRSANLETFADVVRRTPEQVPFWSGQSYIALVGLAIPRVLWPDKPSHVLGQAFGRRYGYLNQDDYYTSYNLPFLIEFYANFGYLGVWIGMFVVGVIFRTLDGIVNRPRQPVVISSFGVVLLLPLLNIESDFSLIFGGLFLNGIALWAVLRLARRNEALYEPRVATASASVQQVPPVHPPLLR